MRMELVLRFDYGSIVPWVRRLQDDTRIAVAGPDAQPAEPGLRGAHRCPQLSRGEQHLGAVAGGAA